MTAEIHKFNGNTLLDLEADDVLEAAKEKLETVIVVGWTHEGDMYLASTTSDTGKILLLMEVAKAGLLDRVINGD